MDQILFSTAYFPPIEYFYLLLNTQSIYIEAHETYLKQTYRNRCHIYSPNGLQALTIPVHKTNGNHTKTCEIKISNHSDWRTQHWRSIQTAYNSSAFFMYYKDEIYQILQFSTTQLLDFNLHILKFLVNEIGIKHPINLTDIYDSKPAGVDMRSAISPKNVTSFIETPEYFQVFSDKHGFLSNLTILDLLFNEGPNTLNYLQSIKKK